MEPAARQVVRGILVALGAAVGLIVVVMVFVRSAAGQRIDETAYEGARIGRWRIAEIAFSTLGVVSVAGIVVATAVAGVIAVSRRRVDLALGVVALVGGSNLTTQALKRWLLERPDLGIETSTLNSLPSGHATVVASLAVALVLVVPPSVRSVTAILGAAATTFTGAATLAVGWHRPSDIVAAMLVVAVWTGLVATSLGLGSRSTAEPAGRSPLVGIGALALVATMALAGSALALVRTWTYGSIPGRRSELLGAYLGGIAGVAGVTCALFAVVLLLHASGRALGTGDRAITPAAATDPTLSRPGRPAG